MTYTRTFPIPDDTQDGELINDRVRKVSGSTVDPDTYGGGEIASIYNALNELDAADTTRIAAHAALTTTHGVTGNIVGTTDAQTLTNKTLGSGTTFGTAPSGLSNIAHQSLGGAGTNTHAQIDSHIADTSTAHGITASRASINQLNGRTVGGTASVDIVTYAQLTSTAFSSDLPGQAGNAGKLVTTDGTNASWTNEITDPIISIGGSNGLAGQVLTSTGEGLPQGWADIYSVIIGDIILSERNDRTPPEWLPATGEAFLQASYPDLFATLGLLPDGTNTKLDNPATLPANNGYDVSFSPDGVYMAVAHDTSPFVTIYKRSGDTFTKLDNPATLPTGYGLGVSFSPDGTHMAVAHATSPYITIYKRSGDTFTKLDNPATLPAGNSTGVSFSPDGVYMAVAHDTSPFVTIYKRSGDTFTKLDNPATLPANNGYDVSFSPDGVYMSVAHNNSPFVTIYKRSGDTFTKLDNPATLPTSAGRGVSFSQDGTHMAVALAVSPYIMIYKRSGDTFTKLDNPATLPTSAGNGVSFSPDGVYMSVAHNNSPFVTIYKRSGDTFTKLDNPAALPPSTGNGVSFSPDGTHMSVAHTTTPYITIYKRMLYDTTTLFITPSIDVGTPAYIKA